eukprot:3590127-Pyramimonas_sp.AAC.1
MPGVLCRRDAPGQLFPAGTLAGTLDHMAHVGAGVATGDICESTRAHLRRPSHIARPPPWAKRAAEKT